MDYNWQIIIIYTLKLSTKKYSKNLNIKPLALILSIILIGHPITNANAANSEYSNEQDVSIQSSHEAYLLQRALLIEQHLANKDFANVTSFIHPIKGVRFSMYAYVNPKTDKVFNREQFAKYLRKDRIKFTWGKQDGSGQVYISTLPNYLDNWLQADIYINNPSTVSINKPLGRGNNLDNLREIYPNSDYVELHNKGINPDYNGMDWRSLRLVFEQYQGDYYLVAIINDQWTI